VVHSVVRLQTRLSEDLGATQETLRTAVDSLAGTSAALQQSFTGDLVPSNRALHQAAAGFAESSQQLTAFLSEGLNPLTQRLMQLDQTFQSLEQALAAIRDLSAARQDIEHLTHSLSQAATIADAISNLPEQVRGILEESARLRTEQQATQGRSGLSAWFRGRK
jgi:uncharacterized protein YoxC